jgi:hypothetical protein
MKLFYNLCIHGSASLNCFIFLVIFMGCQYFGQYIESSGLKLLKNGYEYGTDPDLQGPRMWIRILQNYADPSGSGSSHN